MAEVKLHNGFKGRVFAAGLAVAILAIVLVREHAEHVVSVAWAYFTFSSAVIAGRSLEQYSVYRGPQAPQAHPRPRPTQPNVDVPS